MTGEEKIWAEIATLEQRYRDLRLDEQVDYKKFYLYSIIAHSTAIEGSTLSERDAQLLFDEGFTKKGTIAEHLMNLDLRDAYEYAYKYAVAEAGAEKQTPLSPQLLKQQNSLVMKNTGAIQTTIAGSFDSSHGDFRLCGVTAGFAGRSYMDFKKVPAMVDKLCDEVNNRLSSSLSAPRDIHNLAFDAHLNLVTIHPWIDGNGRTSRLLMNMLQFRHAAIPTKIHKADKRLYIAALERSRDEESPRTFRDFMARQHLKTLREEIRNSERSHESSSRFALLF
jgi:Fic family protein